MGFPFKQMDILFDLQTSGGLMICVKREQADALVSKHMDAGVTAGVLAYGSERVMEHSNTPSLQVRLTTSFDKERMTAVYQRR